MQAFLAILALVAVFVAIYLVRYFTRKGAHALATAANKQVYKSKYQTEQKLVHDTITFETKATGEEIINSLTRYVAPQSALPVVGGALYELSRNSDFIEYAFGNKVNPKIFAGIVQLSSNGSTTKAIFKFTKWTETDGMMIKVQDMKSFSQQVYSAFSAVNSVVRSSASPEISGNVQASRARVSADMPHDGWVCRCGTKNDAHALYCGECGTKRPQ